MSETPILRMVLCLLLTTLPITFGGCCECVEACTSSCSEGFSISTRLDPPSIQRMDPDDSVMERFKQPRIPRISSNPDAEDIGDALGLRCGSCCGSLFKCLCCCFGDFRDAPEVISSAKAQTIGPTFIQDNVGPSYASLGGGVHSLNSKSTPKRPRPPSQSSKGRSSKNNTITTLE